mmetsp:Transcript_4053/g.9216  ORF Transcript_4053/g.9216 Transcript_4053/m.9216 type:complete len:229 (-) Transcript_4053:155-841(-)
MMSVSGTQAKPCLVSSGRPGPRSASSCPALGPHAPRNSNFSKRSVMSVPSLVSSSLVSRSRMLSIRSLVFVASFSLSSFSLLISTPNLVSTPLSATPNSCPKLLSLWSNMQFIFSQNSSSAAGLGTVVCAGGAAAACWYRSSEIISASRISFAASSMSCVRHRLDSSPLFLLDRVLCLGLSNLFFTVGRAEDDTDVVAVVVASSFLCSSFFGVAPGSSSASRHASPGL